MHLDVGGAIFIHAFGAYFGIAVALVMRRRDFRVAEHLEGPQYSSDIFAMIGTILLWVFWPSFNAILGTIHKAMTTVGVEGGVQETSTQFFF